MKFILTYFLVLQFCIAYCQEESFPCNNGGNPNLKKLFTEKELERLYVLNCSGPGLNELATSFLAPTGNPPKITMSELGSDTSEDDFNIANDHAFENWSCQYSPGMLQDYNTSTAWVEGVEGYGIGEIVIVPCLDLGQSIEIWSGYGKSDNLFKQNSRPKKIKFVIIQTDRKDGSAQYGTHYFGIKIIAEITNQLKDLNGYQKVNLPSFTMKTDTKYLLGLQILDVYPGSKWKDTCISEIRNISEQ